MFEIHHPMISPPPSSPMIHLKHLICPAPCSFSDHWPSPVKTTPSFVFCKALTFVGYVSGGNPAQIGSYEIQVGAEILWTRIPIGMMRRERTLGVCFVFFEVTFEMAVWVYIHVTYVVHVRSCLWFTCLFYVCISVLGCQCGWRETRRCASMAVLGVSDFPRQFFSHCVSVWDCLSLSPFYFNICHRSCLI